MRRAFYVNFTEPYFVTGLAVVAGEKAKDIDDYKKLNNRKYKLAVVRGTSGQDFAKMHLPKAKIVTCAVDEDAVKMLIMKKVDVFLYDRPFLESVISYYPNLKLLSAQLNYESYAIAVPKGDPDFLLWLNYFLAELKLSGKYDEIYYRWFRR